MLTRRSPLCQKFRGDFTLTETLFSRAGEVEYPIRSCASDKTGLASTSGWSLKSAFSNGADPSISGPAVGTNKLLRSVHRKQQTPPLMTFVPSELPVLIHEQQHQVGPFPIRQELYLSKRPLQLENAIQPPSLLGYSHPFQVQVMHGLQMHGPESGGRMASAICALNVQINDPDEAKASIWDGIAGTAISAT